MEDLYNWKKRNKLSKRDANNLLESFRRINMFNNGNINAKGVLLSYHSEVGKYYIPDSVEQSKCNNWYSLNVEGKRLVNDIGIEWDKGVNEMLYSFSF